MMKKSALISIEQYNKIKAFRASFVRDAILQKTFFPEKRFFKDQSDALILGSLVHDLMSGDDIFSRYCVSSKKQAYEEGKIFVKNQLIEKAFNLLSLIPPSIEKKLKSGISENSLFFEINGLPAKSRPDFFDDDSIFEIKTSFMTPEDEDEIPNFCEKQGYDFQLAFQNLALQDVLGKRERRKAVLLFDSQRERFFIIDDLATDKRESEILDFFAQWRENFGVDLTPEKLCAKEYVSQTPSFEGLENAIKEVFG